MHTLNAAHYFAVTVVAGICIYVVAQILIGTYRFILEALEEYEGGD